MQAKSKKTKTIQMKYPAPYSQSWTDDVPQPPSNTKKKKSYDTGPSRKNPPAIHSQQCPKNKVNKREKMRAPPVGITQLVYPLPYSKTVHTEKKVSKNRKNATAPRKTSQKVNRAIDPLSNAWRPPKVVRNPDPTVPHLKYGVFQPPKTKPATAKTQAQVQPTASKLPRSISSERDNKKRFKFPKGILGDQRDSSQSMIQSTRQLTISPPKHLDIKPKEGWRGLK